MVAGQGTSTIGCRFDRNAVPFDAIVDVPRREEA